MNTVAQASWLLGKQEEKLDYQITADEGVEEERGRGKQSQNKYSQHKQYLGSLVPPASTYTEGTRPVM